MAFTCTLPLSNVGRIWGASEFHQHVDLALLHLHQFGKLFQAQVVDFFVQGHDFDFGFHVDLMRSMMGIKIDKTEVPAGKVTFEVKNDAKDLQHEMLVAPVADENVVLPYNATENRVDEEKSGDLGEVSELDPGKGGALTLDLKPGTYVLYCNIPGHFMAGMWTTIIVQ